MPNVVSTHRLLGAAAGLAVLLGCPERSTPQSNPTADSTTLRDVRAAIAATPAQNDTTPRDSVADLPRSEVDVRSVPPTGQTIRVGANDNLQSALGRAKPGDVIRLASGATYAGNFILPTKPCGAAPIVVRTDVPDSDLPADGERITPATSARLAKIATRNDKPALRTENPTCGWRLFGIEVTVASDLAPGAIHYALIALGDGGWVKGGDTQTSAGRVPSRIILDRVYVHGTEATNLVRCISLNSSRSAVVNSWVSDCHAKGFDSQAIEGWNGPGPFLIENNFLSGAGETVMFGGADPGIQGLSPSDITIRRNHFFKDARWKGRWTVKNLFELKNARRVLVEDNVFENNWADAQSGMAIVIKSSQDSCGTCTWQGTTDVTFRYNMVKNSPRGFNLQAVDCTGQACVDVHVQRVRAENNLFYNIGTYNETGSDGFLMLLTHDLRDVAIRHNTFVGNIPNRGTPLVMDYGNGKARHLTITDNVFTSGVGYGIFYSGMKVGSESMRAMAGNSWTFARNVIGGVDPQYVSLHPPGNWYAPTIAHIGFVDQEGHDFRLRAKSDFKQRGPGGTDPGADLNGLKKRLEGVVAVVR
ncbi:MAG TPA: right-handed parallel beta-helix repeat-containing protein [Gemmatimonadaceae bacterium]|nr:right-handed parallel beta-helix repeat-containing protein [Gemmatimonadaceae bacterium]